MTITRQKLIDSVYWQVDLPKYQSTRLIKSLLEIIKQTLESGEDILISGFGKFSVKDKEERKGRNPVTGDGMILRARRVVTFQCSGMLREKMNGNPESSL
jgi:integration host factor subunit alpha